MNQTIIFHVDVNSAFLSWEAVYRLSQDKNSPDLRDLLCAVGGDATKRHGIILAKSTSAKKYNVVTGESIFQARSKCPDLMLVPSNHKIYHTYSQALQKILLEYTPLVEQASIDESYLDMTESCGLFGDPISAALQMKDRIKNDLGFTVNIGISSNKLLAKMASDFEKPDRIHTLFPDQIKQKMWPLPVRELYSVGRSAEKKLHDLGIITIGDLANTNPDILRSHLNKMGQTIYDFANGLDSSPVQSISPKAKSYSNEMTLSNDITGYENMNLFLLSLSEMVGGRLRNAGVKASMISIELKDCDFKRSSHQMTLPTPTNRTEEIYQTSVKLLKEHWNENTPIRLIGIRTGAITEENYFQMNLFTMQKNKKMEQLDSAIDKIRGKYGTDAIKRASFLDNHGYTENKD